MLLCGALGSACSGVIVGNFGFPTLNVIAAVVVLPALLLALSSVRRSRQGEGGKSAAVKAAA